MARLHFQSDALSVSDTNTTITLLPKEYALLHFLFKNRGQAFTRQELLDKVWPLEAPVDRTVDDHIYRLRKKLKCWADVVTLDTVRSIGYRLTLKEAQPPLSVMPSMQDEEVHDFTTKLLSKYHLYGQGEAMQMLYQQQKVLGFEINRSYEVYVRFISGDLIWLAEAEEVPLAERLYLLLVTNLLLQGDKEEALLFIERALERQLLPEHRHSELYILDCLNAYMLTGRLEEAFARLEITYQTVKEKGAERGFLLPVMLTESALLFTAGRYGEMEPLLKRMGEHLADWPYLREMGAYRVICGVWGLHKGNRAQGKALIAEGIAILRQSKFMPQLLMYVNRLLYFFKHCLDEPDLEREYKDLWTELSEQYQLEEVAEKTRAILRKVLL